MITAVDTNVLLDILLPDPTFGPASKEGLRMASRQGALIICEVVYAELAGFFPKAEALDTFLQQAGIQLRPSEPQTLWRAGYLWRQFCLGRPQRSEARRRVLADFLLGAHALLQTEQLLTRDKGFYRSAFADLRVASL
jgi:predicted nucleic acid-binding protein